MAQREPCPGRIVDDTGGAFAMGCVGGAIFFFFRGMSNSPRGERFRGGIWAIKYRAPVMGGGFAQWGLTFSFFDCSLITLRRVDSPFNSIMAGALTGASLANAGGIQGRIKQGLIGGIILGIIEGVNAWYMHTVQQQQERMQRFMQLLTDARVSRQMKGLPDFTQEEINGMLMKALEGLPTGIEKQDDDFAKAAAASPTAPSTHPQ